VLRIREWSGEESGTRACPWGNVGPLKSAVEWCPDTMWPGSAAHPGFPCCGEKRTPVWGSAAASRARGVMSGGQLPPSMLALGSADRPTRVAVWAPSLARSIPLINTGEVSEVSGVPGVIIFRFDPTWLDYPSRATAVAEADAGVRAAGEEAGDDVSKRAVYWGFNTPSGVLNLTVLKFGAPVYYSAPHFLHGDAVLRGGVIGLAPSDALHGSAVGFDRATGVGVLSRVRYQVNARIAPIHIEWRDEVLQRSGVVDFLRNVSAQPTYLPIGWVEQSDVVLRNSTASFHRIRIAESAAAIIAVAFAVVAQLACFGLVCVVGSCLAARRREYEEGRRRGDEDKISTLGHSLLVFAKDGSEGVL